MCGRYYIADDDRLGEMVHRLSETTGQALSTGEICPGDLAPVYVGSHRAQLTVLRWGFDTGNPKLLINARSETVDAKAMFSCLLPQNRAFIPARYYFEWDSSHARHTLGNGEEGFYMAGLYRPRENSFVLLTRDAAAGIRFIHPRMPVLFSRQTALAWLNPENNPMKVLMQAQTETIKEVTL